MNRVKIRRPKAEDVKELNNFFRIVITDTFLKEGIGDLLEDMAEEINAKKNCLNRDIISGGIERYFLIALHADKIVGSIEYGPASELINKNTYRALKDLLEVGTVFVHPDYQRKGIGNQLLEAMYSTLKNKGIEEFCLDSGYKHSQKVWRKKFGEPDYLLKDYWGEGAHHMIWRIRVDSI
ncbi:GNAT family acetyltransferase [Sporosarcina globispora]|uniref:GNAT family acetyltransferase n=1 Tax=Sporosarcina globispora TaxID=1459 RepID=A0A0M0G6S6_SPOGL|nr:GNAT family N-acetyltransferase [Sporosarcina globispora]KON85463.1 GNAT family acetyltransferase [Sporosarcina globispora]